MKKVIVILCIIVLVGLGGYFAYNTMQKKGGSMLITPQISPPASRGVVPFPIPTVSQIPLTIISPVNGSTVKIASVVVKGTTSQNAEVFVNETQTMADAKGNFSASLSLDEGDNIIVVTVNDANGNYSEKDITVIYDSGQ